jgi:hypothetical protein
MRHDFAVKLRINPEPLELIHPVDYYSHRGVTRRFALAVGEEVLAVILGNLHTIEHGECRLAQWHSVFDIALHECGRNDPD